MIYLNHANASWYSRYSGIHSIQVKMCFWASETCHFGKHTHDIERLMWQFAFSQRCWQHISSDPLKPAAKINGAVWFGDISRSGQCERGDEHLVLCTAHCTLGYRMSLCFSSRRDPAKKEQSGKKKTSTCHKWYFNPNSCKSQMNWCS